MYWLRSFLANRLFPFVPAFFRNSWMDVSKIFSSRQCAALDLASSSSWDLLYALSSVCVDATCFSMRDLCDRPPVLIFLMLFLPAVFKASSRIAVAQSGLVDLSIMVFCTCSSVNNWNAASFSGFSSNLAAHTYCAGCFGRRKRFWRHFNCANTGKWFSLAVSVS